MKAMFDMDTIQIEITNACINECSNCTRFCGHQKPYFMPFDQFKEAVDSLVDYPRMVGMMGGEPLLHPEFIRFCEYFCSKINYSKRGLWSCFPKGYEHYREVICKTFAHIFLNDHTRNDVHHCPVLVGAEEVMPNDPGMWVMINQCWLQNSWSAAVNPKGAFFCEIAASMSLLFDGKPGWKVEPGWWWKTPKDFTAQMEEYCPKCGCAMPLGRRVSVDGRDDISPKNLERLKDKSFKIKRGKYVLSDLKMVTEPERMASYKDADYRSRIADRYGIFLVLNELNFLTPFLKKEFSPTAERERKSLFEQYKQEAGL
jgi:hypothetical protein